MRDVDTFLPHLRLLFSIWMPRQKEKKKITFQELMESQTGEEWRSVGGGGGGGAGLGSETDTGVKSDAGENRGELSAAATVTEVAATISVSDFHGLEGYIRYLSLTPSYALSPSSSQARTLFLELSLLLVGRVGRVSSVRFATADTMRLCGALHQVTLTKWNLTKICLTFAHRGRTARILNLHVQLDYCLSCPLPIYHTALKHLFPYYQRHSTDHS